MSGSPKHPRKNKATFTRYWNEGHLLDNKIRRIRKNAGPHAEKHVETYKKAHPIKVTYG